MAARSSALECMYTSRESGRSSGCSGIELCCARNRDEECEPPARDSCCPNSKYLLKAVQCYERLHPPPYDGTERLFRRWNRRENETGVAIYSVTYRPYYMCVYVSMRCWYYDHPWSKLSSTLSPPPPLVHLPPIYIGLWFFMLCRHAVFIYDGRDGQCLIGRSYNNVIDIIKGSHVQL